METRIGVYSGTFDPIHQGHMAFAQAAMLACELDEVVFLPEPRPRNKQKVTDISHRTALIERATRASASLRVMSLSSDQFTVTTTLPELRAAFNNAHLTFLVGSDVVQTFPYRWEGLGVLFDQVSFAVGMRSDDSADEIAAIMTRMGQEYNSEPHYTYIHTPVADLASSKIRDGLVDASWLPDPEMLSYIQDHGLYPQIAT
jgi:nicotinate-nucleotide adenylyltransferase